MLKLLLSEKYFTEKLNNIVHGVFDDVYSTRDKELESIKNELKVTNQELDYLKRTLNLIVGANAPQTGRTADDLARYQRELDNQIGSLTEGLPEPPASLTGRKRGTPQTK